MLQSKMQQQAGCNTRSMSATSAAAAVTGSQLEAYLFVQRVPCLMDGARQALSEVGLLEARRHAHVSRVRAAWERPARRGRRGDRHKAQHSSGCGGMWRQRLCHTAVSCSCWHASSPQRGQLPVKGCTLTSRRPLLVSKPSASATSLHSAACFACHTAAKVPQRTYAANRPSISQWCACRVAHAVLRSGLHQLLTLCCMQSPIHRSAATPAPRPGLPTPPACQRHRSP